MKSPCWCWDMSLIFLSSLPALILSNHMLVQGLKLVSLLLWTDYMPNNPTVRINFSHGIDPDLRLEANGSEILKTKYI